MNLEWKIVEAPFAVTLFGISKLHRPDAAYGETIMELLGRVWSEVRNNELPNRGLNHVCYEADGSVFAGVELVGTAQIADSLDSDLTLKTLTLKSYAYCVHTGPYSGLGRTYDELCSAVAASGRKCRKPLLEVYGHWNEDESRLETEIYFSLD